ncbi:MAG: type II toxin-antitoxin system HipA family toxin [Rhodobacteraceae bacterium]|nr:type II toxin-antitoxin system HipA family toxin [Paracoccaceae bacterium]MBR9823794.1 type II toxin-antitoxin system HipA family toxin [Paracoccaceae bacterium]
MPTKGDQLAIPRFGAPSTVILKPESPRRPGSTVNEAYCLRLAATIGLPAAECGRITTPRRAAICVLRSDRCLTRSGGIQRIHHEHECTRQEIRAAAPTAGGAEAVAPLRTVYHPDLARCCSDVRSGARRQTAAPGRDDCAPLEDHRGNFRLPPRRCNASCATAGRAHGCRPCGHLKAGGVS